MSEDAPDIVVARMVERAKHCRRLAKSIENKSVRTTLLHMAEEIEADISRLLSTDQDRASSDDSERAR